MSEEMRNKLIAMRAIRGLQDMLFASKYGTLEDMLYVAEHDCLPPKYEMHRTGERPQL